MFDFKLKKNAKGNVDFIYSVGEGRYGGADMPFPQATAICSKANNEGKLSKATEFIADGYNIKVEDGDSIKYFFGNVVASKETDIKSEKAKK